jgi:holo-[acyl-carrier protein] synthase
VISDANRTTNQVAEPLPVPQQGNSAGLLGVGCDLVDVATMERQSRGAVGARFLQNILTPHEVKQCRGLPRRIAGQWAAKEAVAKAIGTGWDGLAPRQVEVLSIAPDQWQVRRADERPWPHQAHLWNWQVSISCRDQYAVAIALASPPNAAVSATKGSEGST